MTSDFALNSPNVAPNPKIMQNSVRAYCFALLSDAAYLYCAADLYGHCYRYVQRIADGE